MAQLVLLSSSLLPVFNLCALSIFHKYIRCAAPSRAIIAFMIREYSRPSGHNLMLSSPQFLKQMKRRV